MERGATLENADAPSIIKEGVRDTRVGFFLHEEAGIGHQKSYR
jgi:hypothetical protein